ncbi:site-specific recombinase [Desulfocucumis palustris]|uniref:Site-specific recombinase n=1 Tax=Desulfocucumis palustris TaxID=1898651 RepID=A0A2L2XAB1_9FIRM|nr:DUF4368 domain-containing protein [Desulfocucumis palustris]GBF33135.1 site-specific recombinase [Desulfocucumis palustris]
MFSGLLHCADCGAKLYYCTAKGFEERQNHFVCSNYKSNTGTCSVHFIREVVLYALMLEHVRGVIRYVRQFEKVFVRQVSLKSAEERKAEDTGQFLATVRKYTDIQELMPTILNEFISKIIIHAPDKSSGKRKQKVEIVYNGVGILNIPELTDEMLRRNRETA